MNDDQELPPDPKTPSSLSPGDRETLSIIVGSIDRHTEALNRLAAAAESMARSFAHLADRAREWSERKLPWDQK